MGTHPKGPSTVTGANIPLSQFIMEHPETLGDELAKKVLNEGKGNLPFLFKVLSVNTALSIQAHPTKVHFQ